MRQVDGVTDAQPEDPPAPEEECDAAPLEEEVRTQTCRFCDGSMRLTGRTDRPRRYELMEMPLERFREAQAGLTITRGTKRPRVQASARPPMGCRCSA